MNNQNTRQSGSVAVVVLVILVLAVAAYLLVPVFRTQTNVAVKKAKTFSTEQQQKDPVLFIQYVQDELDKSLSTLEAGVIQQKSNKIFCNRTAADSQGRKEADLELLAQAKASYKAAESSRVWPIKLHDLEFSKPQLEARIVELLKQQERYGNLILMNRNYALELTARIAATEKEIEELKSKRADLAVQLEYAKIDQAKNQAFKLNDEVYALLDRCQAIKPPTDGAPSLEALRGAANIEQKNIETQKLFSDFMAQ